jgi:hypothetical protein
LTLFLAHLTAPPFVALIALALASWFVFVIWMACTWPDLGGAPRLLLGLMLLVGGSAVMYVGSIMIYVAASVVDDFIGPLDALDAAIWVANCALVGIPYYAVWRYRRRERIDVEGRH